MNTKERIIRDNPGWHGRLGGHHVCYNANKSVHRDIPYSPNDPRVILQQLELWQSDGFDVIAGTVQGTWAAESHANSMLMSQLCAQVGLQFALLLDPGGMKKWVPNASTAQITANAKTYLSDPATQQMLNRSSYVPEHLVLDFATGADLNVLASAFPGLKFLKQGRDFSWPSIDNKITDQKARNAASVANLKGQNSSPTMIAPGVCYDFDDSGQPLPIGCDMATFLANGGKRDNNVGTWGDTPSRILASFGGQFFLQQLAVTPITAPFTFIVSLTDYEEQSSGPWEKRLAETRGIKWAA
jgi:hypothetical protein